MPTHLQQMPNTCYNGKANEDSNNDNYNNSNHYNNNNNNVNININTNNKKININNSNDKNFYDTHVHRWCYFTKGAEVRHTGRD